MTRIIITAFAACLALTGNAQSLLLNGSFEFPAIPADTLAIRPPTSWERFGSPRLVNGVYGGSEAPGSFDGQQYVSIGNDGIQMGISQTFTVATSGTYTLTWFDNAGNSDIPATAPYYVSLRTSSNLELAKVNLSVKDGAGWTSHTMPLNLTPGSYLLLFYSQQFTPGGLATCLDKVSILGQTPNEPPVANDQSVTTEPGTPKSITLTATDPENDPLTYSIGTNPTHGALSGTPPNVTYTPYYAGFSGPDSFTFKANDGQEDSNPATVSITVGSNNPPVASNPPHVTTAVNTPVNVTLTATDPDGDPLTFQILSQPTHGTAALFGSGPRPSTRPPKTTQAPIRSRLRRMMGRRIRTRRRCRSTWAQTIRLTPTTIPTRRIRILPWTSLCLPQIPRTILSPTPLAVIRRMGRSVARPRT